MAAGNSVWDEIREQNRKMKGKPLKEKWAYFMEYYAKTTIVVIIVLYFVINLIYTSVTATDNGLGVVMINGYTDMDAIAYMENFEVYSEMNTKEYSANMEVNFTIDSQNFDEYVMANVQKFTAMIAAAQLDVAIGDENTISEYSQSDYFYNLNEIFPQEILNEYSDKLLYTDLPMDDIDGEIPIAINITDTALISETQAYFGKEAYFAVIGNTKNKDNVLKFFEYIKTAEIPILK